MFVCASPQASSTERLGCAVKLVKTVCITTPTLPAAKKRYQLVARADKGKIFKVFRAIQNLVEKSDRVTMQCRLKSRQSQKPNSIRAGSETRWKNRWTKPMLRPAQRWSSFVGSKQPAYFPPERLLWSLSARSRYSFAFAVSPRAV